ncbi:MAG: phosphatase PAP2 family protein [Alistipes sp.]|nr:phosphatase PAP2 family protein [Alistipes sp.]
MNGTTWDVALFEALNFDGGKAMDSFMSAVSGVAMWLPLYALILYMVWRRYAWRGLLLFVVAAAVAMGLADVIAGIFKHSGPLKDVWASFPARPRPMWSDGIENIHVPSYEHGEFGTVSAHAATIVSLALLSAMVVQRRWLTVVMIVVSLLYCYSRIYLACHFPQDILLGAGVGTFTGLLSVAMFRYIMKRKRG